MPNRSLARKKLEILERARLDARAFVQVFFTAACD